MTSLLFIKYGVFWDAYTSNAQFVDPLKHTMYGCELEGEGHCSVQVFCLGSRFPPTATLVVEIARREPVKFSDLYVPQEVKEYTAQSKCTFPTHRICFISGSVHPVMLSVAPSK